MPTFVIEESMRVSAPRDALHEYSTSKNIVKSWVSDEQRKQVEAKYYVIVRPTENSKRFIAILYCTINFKQTVHNLCETYED